MAADPIPWLRYHEAHLKELREMEDSKELRRSKYFVMTKSVHRRKSRGRGSKFQNYKVTSFKIKSASRLWSNDWAPSDADVNELIKADFVRDNGRLEWKFYDKRNADKAWVLLAMKYGG